MKRSPIKKVRAKPRPGRVKGAEMAALRDASWFQHKGLCCFCGQYVPHETFVLAHIRAKRRHGDHLENVAPAHGYCHVLSHNCDGKPCPAKVKYDA
jgi:hypothetical protein